MSIKSFTEERAIASFLSWATRHALNICGGDYFSFFEDWIPYPLVHVSEYLCSEIFNGARRIIYLQDYVTMKFVTITKYPLDF